jgi:hypothetical protein
MWRKCQNLILKKTSYSGIIITPDAEEMSVSNSRRPSYVHITITSDSEDMLLPKLRLG